MSTFLETVVARTAADLAEPSAREPAEVLRDRIGPAPAARPFREALVRPGMSLIAEMKRASPSKGPIRPGASVTEIVGAYEQAGARAASVLTEPHWFGGDLADLVEARGACDLPLLRKDFVVDEYQLLEARAAGADAALLIVAALGPRRLEHLIVAADELGLDALVEVHDEAEARAAVAAGAHIIGVNNRDLHSLEVDLDTTFRLRAAVPADRIVIGESGITTRAEVAALEDAGVDAILVGEALMRVPDPREAVRSLLGG